MRSFHYVDFAAHYQKGFRNQPYRFDQRSPGADEILRFLRLLCHLLLFLGRSPDLHERSRRSWVAERCRLRRKSLGAVFANLDHVEVTPALEAAKRLSSFLLEKWAIEPHALQIYFSGAKGFHLLLDTRLCGKIAPSKNLPMIFDSMRRHLAQELPEPLRSTMDLSIKDRVRLLRLPNTIHEKSRLYKVILDAVELESLSPQEIREVAREPRPLTVTDETGLVSRVHINANPGAQALFQRVRRQSAKLMRRPFVYRLHRPANLSHTDFPCAGKQKIWESHIEAGFRNNCAIRLASEFRLLGLTSDETEVRLLEWNDRNSIELSSVELRSVVHSAFQRRFPYRYSCRDAILRRYCPLPDLGACRRHVAERAVNDQGAPPLA